LVRRHHLEFPSLNPENPDPAVIANGANEVEDQGLFFSAPAIIQDVMATD
jgi:hypothetical protein